MPVIAFESDPVLTQQVYFWAKKMFLHLVLCNFPMNFENKLKLLEKREKLEKEFSNEKDILERIERILK